MGLISSNDVRDLPPSDPHTLSTDEIGGLITAFGGLLILFVLFCVLGILIIHFAAKLGLTNDYFFTVLGHEVGIRASDKTVKSFSYAIEIWIKGAEDFNQRGIEFWFKNDIAIPVAKTSFFVALPLALYMGWQFGKYKKRHLRLISGREMFDTRTEAGMKALEREVNQS